jgi:hypothetical protein
MSRTLMIRIKQLEVLSATSQGRKVIVIPIHSKSTGEEEKRRYFEEHPELKDVSSLLVVLIRRFAEGEG